MPLGSGNIFAIITAFCWALEPLLVKTLFDAVTGATLAWLRLLTVGVALTCISMREIKSAKRCIIRGASMVALAALCLGMNNLGYICGLSYLKPVVAVSLLQSGPLLFAFSGGLYAARGLKVFRIAGVLLAAFALGLFALSSIQPEASSDALIGVLWVLLAGVAWTGYAHLFRRLGAMLPPQLINGLIALLASFMLLPWANPAVLSQLPTARLLLLLSADGLNVLAYLCLSRALTSDTLGSVGVILALNPVITALLTPILGSVFLTLSSGGFSNTEILGTALAAIGLAIINLDDRCS